MGQAKLRGTFEERKAQAITEGRAKEIDKENSPIRQLERMAKHPEVLLVGSAIDDMHRSNLVQMLLDMHTPPGLRVVRR